MARDSQTQTLSIPIAFAWMPSTDGPLPEAFAIRADMGVSFARRQMYEASTDARKARHPHFSIRSGKW